MAAMGTLRKPDSPWRESAISQADAGKRIKGGSVRHTPDAQMVTIGFRDPNRTPILLVEFFLYIVDWKSSIFPSIDTPFIEVDLFVPPSYRERNGIS